MIGDNGAFYHARPTDHEGANIRAPRPDDRLPSQDLRSQVDQAVKMAQNMARRVESFRERLIGISPEGYAPSPPNPNHGGMFGEFEIAMNDIGNSLALMRGTLDALDQVLPPVKEVR